jgi:DNA-binding SARP family transcriptional activator
MGKPWRIQMLGALQAVQGCRVGTHFQWRKTRLLLACLAYHLERPQRRDELCEQLWPEADLETGRTNLRNTPRWLRQELEPPGAEGAVLVANRASVRLNPTAVATDVAEFHSLLEEAKGRAAMRPRSGSWLGRWSCIRENSSPAISTTGSCRSGSGWPSAFSGR